MARYSDDDRMAQGIAKIYRCAPTKRDVWRRVWHLVRMARRTPGAKEQAYALHYRLARYAWLMCYGHSFTGYFGIQGRQTYDMYPEPKPQAVTPKPQGLTPHRMPSVELIPVSLWHWPKPHRPGRYVHTPTTAQAVFDATFRGKYYRYRYCRRHGAYHGSNPQGFNYCPWMDYTVAPKLLALVNRLNAKTRFLTYGSNKGKDALRMIMA